MKVISLFSGGGLGDLGFVMAGCEIVAQVEIDEYCQKLLALRYPDARKFKDIRTVKGSDLPECDLITGGFPCQDISCARTHSEQKGIDGERSGLWKEMFRVVCEVRPRFVVVENSPNLTFRGLGTVLRDLASIGFNVEWYCLSAYDFGGPHLRNRLWMLAHTHSDRLLFPESFGRYKEIEWRKKTVWSKYWDEVRAGYTGNDAVCDLEKAKSEGMDKPWLRRVAYGPSDFMDRLKCLGNGQVPACTKWIAEQIIKFEGGRDGE